MHLPNMVNVTVLDPSIWNVYLTCMDRCIKIRNGQYFTGDGFSNLIREFILDGTSVCRMSKLALIKYASIDMQICTQTCVVVLKKTSQWEGSLEHHNICWP